MTAVVAGVTLACTAMLLLLWQAASAILIVLIGILFGVIFDGGARGLRRVLPGHPKIRLIVVISASLLLITLVILWSGATIVQEAGQLSASLRQAFGRVNAGFQAGGLFGEGGLDLSNLVPSATAVFGGATHAVTTTFGALVTFALVLFLGIFFAWEPEAYKEGLLGLLPSHMRPRVGNALDRSAQAMRDWLVGQGICMAVIFVFTLIALLLIGMPFSLLLAVLSALLAFVPTVGPFVAGVLIMLAGLSVSVEMAAYGLGIYLVIQFLESNVLTPIVQERALRLPAASTLVIQLLAGVFFGLLGIAFAIPLVAAAKVLIADLHVAERVGDGLRGVNVAPSVAAKTRKRTPSERRRRADVKKT